MKKVLCILLVTLLMSALVACGGAEPPASPQQETNEPLYEESVPSQQETDNTASEESDSSADDDSTPRSEYTGNFSIVGMWKTSGGKIITFGSDGQCSPTLFGFDGGPNGSYAISSKTDENGNYTLSATHITGGSLVYIVVVTNVDTITLIAEGETYFAASQYALTRM